MLKLTDTGVEIRLVGTPKADYTFVLAVVLLFLAIFVAYLAMTQPVGIAIGAMFGLAVLCFCFNLYKEKLKQKPINAGIVRASLGQLTVNGQAIRLSDKATIEMKQKQLIIQDHKKSWQIGGFESEKEMMVLQSVLQGKAIEKRQTSIRLNQTS